MAVVEEIAGIEKQDAVLLRTAGVEDSEALATFSAESLLERLEEANQAGIVDQLPSLDTVNQWLSSLGPTVADYSNDPDVLEMLKSAPMAISISSEVLKSSRISPSSIADPILLTAVGENVEVRLEKTRTASREAARQARLDRAGVKAIERPSAQEVRFDDRAGATGQVKGLDTKLIRPMEDLMSGEALERLHSADHSDEDSRFRLLTSTRPETNEGVDKGSRRFVKGVLHPLPYRMFFGSVFTILIMLLVPASLAAVIAVAASDMVTGLEVSKWWLIVPGLLPIFGSIYLILANGCRCRICGQKQFLPKNCLKNRNAHKWPLVGHILPTAVHIILFKWFRCIFCGTPVRIKE